MKVYTNTEFVGHYPIGTAAVVVAKDAIRAAELLNQKLIELGLDGDAKPEDMKLVKRTTENVIILLDGNY